MNQHEAMVKERIVKDLAFHVATPLHAIGAYRHWRCQKPGTWSMGFDVVTWPGSLCFTGDMGDYLFQRTEDMVAFMRTACRDYSYAAEKCVAHDGRLKEWSEDKFKQVLKDRLKEGKTFTVWTSPGKTEQRSVKEAIREIQAAHDEYSVPHDATRAMYESCLWDGCDLPNCEVYTFHFLWALHAINWFCQRV